MNTGRSRRFSIAHWGLTLLGMTGIPALFLPFSHDYSPVRAVFDDSGLWQVALPFFLSPLAVAVSLRWMMSGALSRVARAITYAISSVAAAVTLSGYFTAYDPPSDLQEWLSLVMPLATLFLGICLLIRNSRMLPSREFNPVMAIQTAYLANAVLGLIALFGEWQVGAYCALVAASAFMLQTTLISTQRTDLGEMARLAAAERPARAKFFMRHDPGP